MLTVQQVIKSAGRLTEDAAFDQAMRLRATVQFLKVRQRARELGVILDQKDRPDWLVNMAINRRARWPEPGWTFGSYMPVKRCRHEPRAVRDEMHLWRIAHDVNTPRLVVREGELGAWRRYFRARIPGRIRWSGEE